MRWIWLAAILALIVGCAKPPKGVQVTSPDAFVGSWSSDAPKSSLDMNADHTFTLKVSKVISGKWKSSDMIADLEANGKDKPPMNAVLSNDKKTLTLTGDPTHPFEAGALTMEFKR